MPSNNSVYSIFYPVLDIDGKSVKDRIQMINNHLPKPTSRNEAIKRAEKGLYAIGQMSCMLMEQLCEDEEYSSSSPIDYWSKIAVDLESKFQGNINSVLVDKLYRYRKATQNDQIENILCELAPYMSDIDLMFLEEDIILHDDPVAFLTEKLREFKSNDSKENHTKSM